eukprot:scaffold22634_cov123-Cylindrotheca_fusiformis.AAC.15
MPSISSSLLHMSNSVEDRILDGRDDAIPSCLATREVATREENATTELLLFSKQPIVHRSNATDIDFGYIIACFLSSCSIAVPVVVMMMVMSTTRPNSNWPENKLAMWPIGLLSSFLPPSYEVCVGLQGLMATRQHLFYD